MNASLRIFRCFDLRDLYLEDNVKKTSFRDQSLQMALWSLFHNVVTPLSLIDQIESFAKLRTFTEMAKEIGKIFIWNRKIGKSAKGITASERNRRNILNINPKPMKMLMCRAFEFR